ncbi:MAG: methyltransferase [Rhizobiaceae bacterium]
MSEWATGGKMVGADKPQPSMLRAARERWRCFRTRMVANPAFRRFAAAFPLTRPVARRRTRALFDLAAGFVYSQVLSAFVRLGLVEHLHQGPRDLANIARHGGLSEKRALRLMRAAIALDLAAEGADGRYRLGETGAALVGNDGVLAMIAHHQMLYEDLTDPVALLRDEHETKLSRFWSYAGGDAGDTQTAEDYSRLMARSQEMVAREVLDVLPLKASRHLLDIGGGSGAFVMEAARRHKQLRIDLFDLPPVAEIASARIAAAGFGERIFAHGGSVFEGSLPSGVDVATLVRVLHDHDDEAAMAMLRAAHACLAPGGTLVVAEPMAGTKGAEPAGDAYFGFYLMAMGQGRPRTLAEIAAMLARAGFAQMHELRTATPLIVRVVTGRKAPA